MEEWKTIPKLPLIYLASNTGKIKRLSYSYKTTFRGKSIKRTIKEKILSGKKLSKKGYCRVSLKINLSMDSKSKQFFVHRLIAMAFLGESKLQVNHKNGIKTDNSLENLEYFTNQENRDHAVKNNLIANRSNGFCKFTYDDIKKIKQLRSQGLSQKEIANKIGSKQQTISSLLRIKDPIS